jgi:hypothetical protein
MCITLVVLYWHKELYSVLQFYISLPRFMVSHLLRKQNEEWGRYWSWHPTLLLFRGLNFITTFLLPWVTASPRIFCIITLRLQCRAELSLCYNLMNIQVATFFSLQHPSYLSATVLFHLSSLCCTRSTFHVTSHHASPLHIAVPFGS